MTYPIRGTAEGEGKDEWAFVTASQRPSDLAARWRMLTRCGTERRSVFFALKSTTATPALSPPQLRPRLSPPTSFIGCARGGSTGGSGFMAQALREAYLTTDRQIVDRGTESGAAAATLYLRNGGFLAANVGDVRIVLKEGGRAVALTIDHKPDLPEETARIEALGGRVLSLDVPRVEGFLAMSRALGDAPLKPFVTPEPRIAEGVLGRKDDLAIIASDGMWDVLTSDEAVTLAYRGGGACRSGPHPPSHGRRAGKHR